MNRPKLRITLLVLVCVSTVHADPNSTASVGRCARPQVVAWALPSRGACRRSGLQAIPCWPIFPANSVSTTGDDNKMGVRALNSHITRSSARRAIAEVLLEQYDPGVRTGPPGTRKSLDGLGTRLQRAHAVTQKATRQC